MVVHLMQLIAAEGVRTDLVPLGLIVAGLVVAVLAVLLLLPRQGGRRAGRVPARAGIDAPATTDTVAVASRLAAELDARADRLERLLAEAREAIARLEGASAGSGGMVEGKPLAGGVPPGRTLDTLTARIYELADSGRTPVEIAQTTGQHTGQVELILALRR